MARVVQVLVAVACLVVIAAGGLWLWQQAPTRDAKIPTLSAAECAGYVETLQLAASSPSSVGGVDLQAATEGRIKCVEAGIR